MGLNYWERRQAEDMVNYMQSAEETADQVSSLYQKASWYITLSIDKIFDKFREKHGLSAQAAQKLLDRITDKGSLEELLRMLKNAGSSREKDELVKKLEAPAYRARIEHLQQIQGQLDRIMAEVYQQEVLLHTSHYKGLAKEAYYRNLYNLQQRTGIGFSFAHLDEKAIDRALRSKWSGKNYSARIWGNTQGLAQAVKEELLINFVTGRSNREAALDIQKKFAASANAARRLVRTESNYFATQMHFEAYQEAGIEQYCYLAVLDLRTSKVCQSLDKKIFPVSERKTGVNCPPMHPWCRSTTIAVISEKLLNQLERRTRDPVTGKVIRIPMGMSYRDWYEKYVEGKKEGGEAEE